MHMHTLFPSLVHSIGSSSIQDMNDYFQRSKLLENAIYISVTHSYATFGSSYAPVDMGLLFYQA